MKRYISIKNIIAVVVIATILKFWINILVFDNGVAWNYPNVSPSFSRVAGVFVSPARAEPHEFECNGTRVSFKQVWIERQVKTAFPYIWFNSLKPSGKNLLCFTLAQGREIFGGGDTLFFTVNGAGQSFGMMGHGRIFWQELSLDDFPKHKLEVSLVKNWTDRGNRQVEITW